MKEPTALSWIQKLFVAIFPRSWAESMEADSRAWKLHCDECGHAKSIWEMGGIRWKAVGESRNYMKCVQCGKRSWHKMKYDQPPSPPAQN